MSLTFNVLLLVFGLVAAILPFVGETIRRDQTGFVKRITCLGWIAFSFVIATLLVGIMKEFNASWEAVDKAQKASLKEDELTEQLKGTEQKLSSAQEKLSSAQQKFSDAQRKLSDDLARNARATLHEEAFRASIEANHKQLLKATSTYQSVLGPVKIAVTKGPVTPQLLHETLSKYTGLLVETAKTLATNYASDEFKRLLPENTKEFQEFSFAEFNLALKKIENEKRREEQLLLIWDMERAAQQLEHVSSMNVSTLHKGIIEMRLKRQPKT